MSDSGRQIGDCPHGYAREICAQCEIARLKAINADLLAACERAFSLISDEDNNREIVNMAGSFGLLLDLQSAIAKARGNQA